MTDTKKYVHEEVVNLDEESIENLGYVSMEEIAKKHWGQNAVPKRLILIVEIP